MTYSDAKVILDSQGYYQFVVTVDGMQAVIDPEQRLRDYGLIFIGADFEEIVPTKTVPPDVANGRFEEWEVRGFSDDAELVALYDAYLAMADGPDGLRVGPVRVED